MRGAVFREPCMLEIRPARLDEKRKTYEWLCLSDSAAMHMGPPDYPEHLIPSWDQFQEEFSDEYYGEERVAFGVVYVLKDKGEEVGCLCSCSFHVREQCAELDIWLRARSFCGQGLGPRALRLLVARLRERGIRRFLIRPAERNLRAIRAYEKAGFQRAHNKAETVRSFLKHEHQETYGAGDYGFKETAVLVLA